MTDFFAMGGYGAYVWPAFGFAAAVLTGTIPEAIALIALFNLGRFLPVAASALPVNDYQIQAWLARNQERAAMADGAILVALGAAFGVAALA